MDAEAWDERYASTPLVWSAGPNALFAELTADLPAGRALDVACGEGRTALWLADRGWSVHAVDFSSAGIAKGRTRAESQGLRIEWEVADVTSADLGQDRYDLVAVLYLHLEPAAIADVLRRCVAALAAGGRLIVLGHDRSNLTEGVGGPQEPAILHDPDELTDAVRSAGVDGLTVQRAERVRRDTADGTAIDTLLVAVRGR